MPNAFLDVDDSLLENNLLFVNKQEDDLAELLKTFEKPEIPFALVKPMPGVCVKMKTDSGDKGFINICHTKEIPAPEDISEEKLISVATSDELSFVIPMSIGQERFEADKGGAMWPAYDIAINAEYFNKCQDEKIFMLFTIQVMVEVINNKFNKTFDCDNYVVLKNRKVIGKLQQQRIEKRKVRKPQFPKKMIEEVKTNSKKSTISSSEDAITKKSIAIEENKNANNFVILQNPAQGKPKKLIGLFRIPTLVENINVDVGEDRIIVESTIVNYLVDVFVPYSLNREKIYAEFDTSLGILRLNLPVKL